MYGSLSNLMVFYGSANAELAHGICKNLEIAPGRAQVRRFSDGESQVQILDNIRNRDVLIIQSIQPPVNDILMELMLMVDAAKRASASSITALIPYYGYGRNDVKLEPRTPISAKLIADMLQTAGVEHLISLDMHANQIQGFFDMPVDNLYGARAMVSYLKKTLWKDSYDAGTLLSNIVVVSPDASGTQMARVYAKHLDSSMAIVDKRSSRDQGPEIVRVVGRVNGKDALLFDDMVDTANNLTRAAEAVMRLGSNRVWACCTHPVLSEDSVKRIEDSPIERLLVSDSIPLNEEAQASEKIIVVSMAELLAETIRRMITNDSISELSQI